MAACVDFQSVTKRFGRRVSLRDVTFSVPAGSVTVLVGPNGSGKTTAVRAVLGLVTPDNGTVAVFGERPSGDTRGRIGYIAGSTQLPHEWMLGSDVLMYHRRYFGTWDDNKMRLLVKRLECDPSTKYSSLSHGQRRRVQLICALSHNPSLLVLDEPFAPLDPQARLMCRALLRQHLTEVPGSSVIMSSHDRDDVSQLADCVVVLSHGQVEQFEDFRDAKGDSRKRAEGFAVGWSPDQ